MQRRLQRALRGSKVCSKRSLSKPTFSRALRVLFACVCELSVSALQTWTVAASQTASGLSSTCPVSNTPTGESTPVWLVTRWEQTAPARFYSMSPVSLPGASSGPAAMLAFVHLYFTCTDCSYHVSQNAVEHRKLCSFQTLRRTHRCW